MNPDSRQARTAARQHNGGDHGMLRFSRCTLDVDRRTFAIDGQPQNLLQNVLHRLACLALRMGRAVARKELPQVLWSKDPQSECALARTVLLARHALQDAAPQAREILTVPRFGYRHGKDVTHAQPHALHVRETPPAPADPDEPIRRAIDQLGLAHAVRIALSRDLAPFWLKVELLSARTNHRVTLRHSDPIALSQTLAERVVSVMLQTAQGAAPLIPSDLYCSQAFARAMAMAAATDCNLRIALPDLTRHSVLDNMQLKLMNLTWQVLRYSPNANQGCIA